MKLGFVLPHHLVRYIYQPDGICRGRGALLPDIDGLHDADVPEPEIGGCELRQSPHPFLRLCFSIDRSGARLERKTNLVQKSNADVYKNI